jgi:hypothetical protein
MTNDVLTALKINLSPKSHLHLAMEMGLVRSRDLKSYACGSVSTGRDTRARKVKSEVPDNRHPSFPGWGLGNGLTTLSCKKNVCPENNKIEFTTEQMLMIRTQVKI